MREHTFDNPFNVCETHQGLASLPELTAPSPCADGDIGVAIIPLFSSPYWRKENIHAYVRAALHSRASCLRNTDAVDVGVEVKIYLEDVLLNPHIQTLLDNHIDFAKDVVVFNAPYLKQSKDGRWGQYAKKVCSFYDSKFAKYEWVIGWDADVFFSKGTDFSFKKILDQAPDIGYIWVRENIKWCDWEDRWFKKLEKTTSLSEIPISHYTAPISTLGNFRPDDELQYPVGYLWTYPSKHFHTLNKDWVYWMSKFAPYMGSDELTASLWSHQFDLDIVSLKDKFGWKTVDCNLVKEGESYTLLHGNPNTYKTVLTLLEIIGWEE